MAGRVRPAGLPGTWEMWFLKSHDPLKKPGSQCDRVGDGSGDKAPHSAQLVTHPRGSEGDGMLTTKASQGQGLGQRGVHGADLGRLTKYSLTLGVQHKVSKLRKLGSQERGFTPHQPAEEEKRGSNRPHKLCENVWLPHAAHRGTVTAQGRSGRSPKRAPDRD